MSLTFSFDKMLLVIQKMSTIPNEIYNYNKSLKKENLEIGDKLLEIFSSELKNLECKIWYKAPVWFIDGNPIVGYFERKSGVAVLFWSGQEFHDNDLKNEGKFKAAEINYSSVSEIKVTKLKKWLKQAKILQWDYKNIVKRKGKLVKVGKW